MRVGIIGMGYVGASVAISTLSAGVASELLLADIDQARAQGEALDLAHGAPFYPAARVRVAAVDELRDCDAVVIAAGRGGGPTESRLALADNNAAVMRDLGSRLAGMRGLVIVVTNPVDVLTRLMQDVSGLPPERVLGTGTLLDTARLRHVLGRELEVDARSVHAQVVGEHGDSEVVLWSSAHVGGRHVRSTPGWQREREPMLAAEVRTAAYEIIRCKGATNHAIGLATARLLNWALRDERRVVTVSRVHERVAGHDGVALSLPAVVGQSGATRVLEPAMDDSERTGLAASAAALDAAYARLRRD